MSYILDALRRAESERDREHGVPGLNAQPVPVGSLLGMPSGRSKAGLWIVLGLALGLAVPLGWRWMTAGEPETPDTPPQTRAAISGQVQPVPGVPAPMPSAAPPQAPALPQTPPPVAAATATPPTPAPAPARAVRPPVELPAAGAAPGRPAPPPQPAAMARGPAPNAAEPARPAPPATRPAPGRAQPPSAVMAAPLQKQSDLPEDLRRQVPTLAFGGSVYSALPAQRMVIFNGQVLREGDPVADGLVVEEIRAKSAVLRVRGQRFEVVF